MMAGLDDIADTIDEMEYALSQLENGEAMTVERLQSRLSAWTADLRLGLDQHLDNIQGRA